MAVGIFDSGLGGLTVLQAIQHRMPELPLVYYSDNANSPYGVRDNEDIYQLTCKGVERFWDYGCDLVILACNTASAVALHRMQQEWLPKDKRVLGVLVPVIETLTERDWADNSPPKVVELKQLALFATPATVASRAFQRELSFRATGVDVEAQACTGLVDAIEAGDTQLAEALVESHVAALLAKMPEPQAAVLGCTHYPLLQACFQRALGEGVKVYSQAELVAVSLGDYLGRRPGFLGSGGEGRFLTSGDVGVVGRSAGLFLPRKSCFQVSVWECISGVGG